MEHDVVRRLAGSRVLVLNWRDVRHPQAGGAERYMHEIGRRWVDAGIHVTWFAGRSSGQVASEDIDGIHVVRFGGPLSLYPRAALKLLRARRRFDAVVDCQNGIPFFSPLFIGRNVPVVLVMHHVHQDQFSDRFSRPMAALGRVLEARVARRVYGDRVIVAVSPSTRSEVRRRLGLRGPIHVVPNGIEGVPARTGPRASEPTIVVVARLVPHKRLDLLLAHIAAVTDAVPRLRVEIVGDGPELVRLRGLVADLAIDSHVTFHGRLPDEERDRLLNTAWLTTSTSVAEGWGCTVIEAAAWGVPCVGLRVPGIRDSVIDGRTGWLVDDPRTLDSALIGAVQLLHDERRRKAVAAECQEWARSFSWDRSAELLAEAVLQQAGTTARGRHARNRRRGRPDIAVVAAFPGQPERNLRSMLRCTDRLAADAVETRVILGGCDEHDGGAVLRRLGARGGALRLADGRDLLIGPTVPRTNARESSEVDAADLA